MEIVHKCPLCSQDVDTLPSEAEKFCELCGMSMNRESPFYMVVSGSTHHNLCSSGCVKMYHASRGLKDMMKMR